MKKVKIVEGEIFTDYRGLISSLNGFDFEGVERFYFIHDSPWTGGFHGCFCCRKKG